MVKWKLPAISLLAFIGVCSCRVFEDRDVCNSYLTVDFTNVDKGIREWQMWLFNGAGELIYKDTVYRRSYASPYVVQVPRYGQVKCLLWAASGCQHPFRSDQKQCELPDLRSC